MANRIATNDIGICTLALAWHLPVCQIVNFILELQLQYQYKNKFPKIDRGCRFDAVSDFASRYFGGCPFVPLGHGCRSRLQSVAVDTTAALLTQVLDSCDRSWLNNNPNRPRVVTLRFISRPTQHVLQQKAEAEGYVLAEKHETFEG